MDGSSERPRVLVTRLIPEARGTTVLCGHDEAQWLTLRKGADAYE